MKKNQAGSTTSFLLLMLASFFSLAGIAIDLGRLEKARTSFQLHLDNATFLAVSSNQPVASSIIVKGYMYNSDINEKYHIKLTKCTNNELRCVSATATVKFNAYFLKLFNLGVLEFTVHSS